MPAYNKYPKGKPAQWAWIFYDFANSSFTTVMVTAFFGLYYQKVIIGDVEGTGSGDFYWGLSLSLSAVILGLIAPFLGALADHAGITKKLLMLFSWACIICTTVLFAVPANAIFIASALFIVANIGFEGGTIFYNALLPVIAPPDRLGRVSGYGWAIGYFGGIGCLLLTLPLAKGGFGADNIANARLVMPLVALFFLVSALPAFIFLPETQKASQNTLSGYFAQSWREVFKTLKEIPKHKSLLFFLLAFFFYNDAITTIIKFTSVFAVSSLKFSIQESILLLIAVNITAAIGAYGFGFLADKFGAKQTVLATLYIWFLVTVSAYFVTSRPLFWVISVIAGIALGSSQSASRTLLARLAPQEKMGELFGFMAICGRFSSVLGPLVFGLASLIFNDQRPAVLAMALFFGAGILLLMPVREQNSTAASENS